jgi:hypothetical protein
MSRPQIETYRFGRLVVDGREYRQDVIILPERVVSGWWRKHGHTLLPDDLEAVLEVHPDILIVGQGAYGRMHVAAETRQVLQAADIALIAESTKQACQRYNELRTQDCVAAALHLTC